MKLHEWIKMIIDTTPSLTQKGLAEATGLNPATINRMLYGRRHIRAEEVPLIEQYLGRKYNDNDIDNSTEYTQPASDSNRAFSDIMPRQGFITKNNITTDIPVYFSCANKWQDSLILDKAKIVDWVARHPAQQSNDDAFAIYITTNQFEPRYYIGELLYIHSARPPISSQDCLLKKYDDSVILARYKEQSSEYVILNSLCTKRELKIPLSEIDRIYSVVGRG